MAIRTCIKEGETMKCPVKSGETIVSDCTCNIEDDDTGFAEAISAIGVLDEATKDMICSSSPP